jgi:adenosylcobyric acid synthase
MTGDKRLSETQAIHTATGVAFSGYEMHKGVTTGPDCARPFARISARDEGATSPDGRITGSYLHGMFRDDAFRHAFLAALGAQPSATAYDATVETTLDALAAHMEAHLDLDRLFALAT